jgi:pterin-4a-carbinolamine dehydratase
MLPLVRFLNESKERAEVSPDSVVGKILGSLSTTVPSDDLPVSAESSEWITYSDPDRISRTFEFLKFSHLSYFVNELLSYQEENQHHATMTIENREVTIESYTHGVNAVTEQDIKLSKFCNELYEDVNFFNIERED